MKLRIKETGEIVELVGEFKRSDGKPDFTLDSYDTLAQLCEAVEDYEEKELEKNDAWGEGVKTKKLDCGIAIAMEDYYEIDEDGSKKTEFTFDEALEIEKKTGGKWRVPTIKEWLQIVLELSTTEDGNFDRAKLVEELNLAEDKDGFGVYWSSTVDSDSVAYGLYYNSSELYPACRSYRDVGWSVRLVKGDAVGDTMY